MATTRLMTVEDLEREGTPEGRWELIDGELVEMSPSGGVASKVAIRFAHLLMVYADPQHLGEVFGADGGFVLFPDRPTIRVPDVAFVRAERLPAEADQVGFLRLAPDLVVEVLSPTDRMVDVLAKVAMYHDAGVPLVFLVDPRTRSVAVYPLGGPPRDLAEGDEIDGGDVLPGFRVPVTELFVWSIPPAPERPHRPPMAPPSGR